MKSFLLKNPSMRHLGLVYSFGFFIMLSLMVTVMAITRASTIRMIDALFILAIILFLLFALFLLFYSYQEQKKGIVLKGILLIVVYGFTLYTINMACTMQKNEILQKENLMHIK